MFEQGEGMSVKRQISIGIQDFESIRSENRFYIDKTCLISEWWDRGDAVTLITRPRRFGKTLNMSMLNCFFSNKYEDRSDLFESLEVWKREDLREQQGKWPVISLSFAGVKADSYEKAKKDIMGLLDDLYKNYQFVLESSIITEKDRADYAMVNKNMDESTAAFAVNRLCELLYRYYGKKVIILLDEYDTPTQEAYLGGYWDKLTSFFRSLFNNTFKTNSCLERAVMTGITRISRESIFSDLNNLNVVTTTSDEYSTCFGFTEEEVFAAMDEQGIEEDKKALVKKWYDGFNFGNTRDIYNPWSVIMFLSKKRIETYWANTSSNGLVSRLLAKGNNEIKKDFERLLCGESITTAIDEQIVFDRLDNNISAVWSLLLSSGYLKVVDRKVYYDAIREDEYTLVLTNLETELMFRKMISDWFRGSSSMNFFIKAMFAGNTEDMNDYINDIALSTFSCFDTGKESDEKVPENFYHGFVLGLMVDNAEDYILKSNRESGFGRYDVVMEPKDKTKPAVIMEFKVRSVKRGEKNLEDAALNALKQIEDKKYESSLLASGIPKENILKYGFAFEGKKCLIKRAE